ncbi:MAG: hypothetical protein IPK07_17125 [Deltaproteobacteria bacterium]|nr:hypothetical protein [Deltaproteobacteria bacterium]
MERGTTGNRARTLAGLASLVVLGLAAECHLVAPTDHDITVGPGFSDVSPHQVVRTSAGLLYTVTATCKFYPSCGSSNTILVRKADQVGTPTALTVVGDSADVGILIGAVAIAIDGQDRIHALWTQRDGFVRYGIFDTATDSWGAIEAIEATNWTDFAQRDQGVGLALDPAGVPYATWSHRPTAGAALRTHFSRRLAGGWETPIEVADVVDCDPATVDCGAWHPTVAFKPNGDFLVAWGTSSFPYERDGWVHVCTRTHTGTWLPSVRIEEHSLGGLDDGPSMIVTPMVSPTSRSSTSTSRPATGTTKGRAGRATVSHPSSSRTTRRSDPMARTVSSSMPTVPRRSVTPPAKDTTSSRCTGPEGVRSIRPGRSTWRARTTRRSRHAGRSSFRPSRGTSTSSTGPASTPTSFTSA